MTERTVIEAASWRLASSLVRRHPELAVRREHPGRGQYDVLALRTGRGCTIMLNRAGTVQVHGRDDCREPRWDPLSWAEVLTRDPQKLLAELEQASGLPIVTRPPVSTAPVLVVRVLSALANLHTLALPIDINMEFIDSSGYDGGRADWLRRFDDIETRVQAIAAQPDGPSSNYWCATSRDLDIALHTPTGQAWAATGHHISLPDTYNELARSMPRLLAAVLELGATT